MAKKHSVKIYERVDEGIKRTAREFKKPNPHYRPISIPEPTLRLIFILVIAILITGFVVFQYIN